MQILDKWARRLYVSEVAVVGKPAVVARRFLLLSFLFLFITAFGAGVAISSDHMLLPVSIATISSAILAGVLAIAHDIAYSKIGAKSITLDNS